MFRDGVSGTIETIESRGLIPKVLRNLWKKWQLRSLVILSLFLQIWLMLLGKLRRRNGKPSLRFSVWFAYLLADWVATIALGVIFKNILESPKMSVPSSDDLMLFWTPFLLLHLGGPDTITAYSLEDNQLWQRRGLELLTQLVVAGNIFLMALPSRTSLFFLTIPMFVVGVIKFVERIWALRLASTEQFLLSLLTEPDPGPNYPKFMEEFTLKKAEGFYVNAFEVVETPLPSCVSSSDNTEDLVLKASKLFRTFKRLFVDLILSFQDRDESQCFFRNLKYDKAFEVIEIELGFAYDVFYTKAPAIYNTGGQVLRLFTFFTTLSSLVIFVYTNQKDYHQKFDLILTYLLLGVAIILEVYSYLIFVFSDWSDYWLKKRKSIISWFRNPSFVSREQEHTDTSEMEQWKRWSNMIAQYSIHNFCREENSSVLPRLLKFFIADNKVDEIWYLTRKKVSSKLKEMIFDHFSEISKCGDKSGLTALCISRGKRALEKFDCDDNFNWYVTEVEFDQSILVWHIATELCYYADKETSSALEQQQQQQQQPNKSHKLLEQERREESKHMSEYMLYLLVMCPFMLPMGIGIIRFRDTCAEAREFFKDRRGKPDKVEACRMLLRVNTEIQPGKVKGDRSKSVLFDACRVATQLRSMGAGARWEIISHVWIEILAYAACHCRGTHHAQQLRKGGEFLTHIWLLMAHLGITEQFQISQGHARAKLSAK